MASRAKHEEADVYAANNPQKCLQCVPINRFKCLVCDQEYGLGCSTARLMQEHVAREKHTKNAAEYLQRQPVAPAAGDPKKGPEVKKLDEEGVKSEGGANKVHKGNPKQNPSGASSSQFLSEVVETETTTTTKTTTTKYKDGQGTSQPVPEVE